MMWAFLVMSTVANRLPVVHVRVLSVAPWPARVDRSPGDGRPDGRSPRRHGPLVPPRRSNGRAETMPVPGVPSAARSPAGRARSRRARANPDCHGLDPGHAGHRPATFTSTVTPLSEHLHLASVTATGTLAADIRAHLGIRTSCAAGRGARDLKIEEEYRRRGRARPGQSVRAGHGGHWLAVGHRPLEEVKERFRIALTSGREARFCAAHSARRPQWYGTPRG